MKFTEHSPARVSATRRDFLLRSAGGAATLAAGVGGPLILSPSQASAQPYNSSVLQNLANPAISPNLTTGDAYQFTIYGAPNTAVSNCTQINGGSWTCSSQGATNSSGFAVVTGNAGIVGSYLQSWYVGSTQCSPQLSFRVYPWNTSISKSVMQNVAASALALYHSPGASTVGNCANPYQTFFDHIDNLGLTPSFVNAIQNYYASNGIPTFNSTLQSQFAQWAAQMGWSSLLTQDFFRLESLAQIALNQIQPLNSQSQWDSLGGNYTQILNWISSYVSAGQSMSPALGGPSLAQKNAETGAAVGGAIAGGGTGLVIASGAAADLGIAAGTAFTIYTGGVGLIVIGIAIAGYYGWQWMNSNVSNPGSADQVPTTDIFPPNSN